MRKYTVKREDQVLGEFSAEQIRQQKDAGKRIGFLFKCAAVSVLVAILTFWLSESAFRPPTVEYESGGRMAGIGQCA
jgi:hypothetical protein